MGKKARTLDAAVDAVIQDVVEKRPFVINVRDAAVKLAKKYSDRRKHIEAMIKGRLRDKGLFWRDEGC